MSLTALEAQVRSDLERIDHPSMPWLEPRTAPDGTPALDVLIVGGGQSGVAVGFGLLRAKVSNILVIDQAPRGQEGPWRTFARMRTLRSPKDYTGPDLDIPSLTYRSWHEARFGAADWDALGLIPREYWADYLLWVRDITGVPVRNETRMTGVVAAAPGLLAVTVDGPDGPQTLHCRKLVLATGQDGTGRWWMPDFIAALPNRFRAHAADPIDFDALRGKVVAVLGVGASALDNAAAALEAGAASVHVFCRRATPQLVQSYRWLTFAGFLRHLSDLDDAWRWRFMGTILSRREGFPQPTWDRCAAWSNFHLHCAAPWQGARVDGERVIIDVAGKPFTADFIITGTGMDVDFAHRPELAAIAPDIATWADRYTPPDDLRNDRLGRYPYLASDYSFTEKIPGSAPELADIHVFSIASTMSFGASGSSINAMTTAVPKLVSGLTRGLFKADIERHWASFAAYDTVQAVLTPTPAIPVRRVG
jgi:cation diffusion facilitator CzcD-associated flavoprotein CzcO